MTDSVRGDWILLGGLRFAASGSPAKMRLAKGGDDHLGIPRRVDLAGCQELLDVVWRLRAEMAAQQQHLAIQIAEGDHAEEILAKHGQAWQSLVVLEAILEAAEDFESDCPLEAILAAKPHSPLYWSPESFERRATRRVG